MEKDKKYNIVLGLMIFLFVIVVAVCLAWGLGIIGIKRNKVIEKTNENQENITEIVREVEKQVALDDVIKLGYNNIVFLVNGKPYYIPVYDRENNYSDYKINEIPVSGEVSKIRMFGLGTDPSETTFLVFEDGHVEKLDGLGKTSMCNIDTSKKLVDVVQEKENVYAISKDGEKIKIAESYIYKITQ